MTTIQLVLIAALSIVFFIYFSVIRNRLFDRLLIMAIILSGIVFVVKPDWLTSIANLIGIGRGTDLLIYLVIVVFFYLYILLIIRIRKIEGDITCIIRNNAIKAAKELGDITDKNEKHE